MSNLILASGSSYKAALLQRLMLPFSVEYPKVEECAIGNELPRQTAERLARKKAYCIAEKHHGSIVIGADQVADLNGYPINKPGTHDLAVKQLKRQSGNEVFFHSGLAMVRFTSTGDCEHFTCVNTTKVIFRQLSDREIEGYLRTEEPYDCAGSFKAEGLGISLFTSIMSSDPSSLIGLPLIDLCSLLANFKVKVN